MLVDAAAVIPYGTSVKIHLVSRRVGNVQVNPIVGPLLAQMWVQ